MSLPGRLWLGLHAKKLVRSGQNVIELDDALCKVGSGNVATKAQVVASWANSARRTGALTYIRQGWAIPQVAYLGPWKSNVIYSYAEEALETMPVNDKSVPGRHGNEGPGWDAVRNQLALEVEALKLDTGAMRDKLDTEVSAWKEKVEAGNGELPSLVKNVHGSVIHTNASMVACSPPATWRTRCGWYYGYTSFIFMQGTSAR